MKLQKIIFLFVTLYTLTSFSQTEKGSYMIGVGSNLNFNASYNTVKGAGYSRDAGSEKAVNISSEIGYALKTNFFVGMYFNYAYQDTDDEDFGYESITNTVSAAPYFKYYFSENNIKPFLIASYGLGTLWGKSKFVFNNNNSFSDSKRNYYTFNFGGGVSYFFNKNINVELSLKYHRNSFVDEDDPNEKNITNNINSNIGFTIFL